MPTNLETRAPTPAPPVADSVRDVLSPREVAQRTGFSYHAILRAIRRGDLYAFEPVPGHYRIELVEYERWLHRPVQRDAEPTQRDRLLPRSRARSDASGGRGSLARLRAIEQSE